MQTHKLVCILILSISVGCIAEPPIAENSNTPTQAWVGSLSASENTDTPRCSYTGSMNLELAKNGSAMIGTYRMTLTGNDTIRCPASGSFGPTAIIGNLTRGGLAINDPFAYFWGLPSDNFLLYFESCPNQRCADGTTAIGIKGVANLTKIT